jgi:hypothetical protein
MTMQAIDLWLSVIGILLSGIAVAVLLRLLKSLGAYTQRIECSNTVTRQSNETVRQEILRWRESNDLTLKALHKVRQDLINQRSA